MIGVIDKYCSAICFFHLKPDGNILDHISNQVSQSNNNVNYCKYICAINFC